MSRHIKKEHLEPEGKSPEKNTVNDIIGLSALSSSVSLNKSNNIIPVFNFVDIAQVESSEEKIENDENGDAYSTNLADKKNNEKSGDSYAKENIKNNEETYAKDNTKNNGDSYATNLAKILGLMERVTDPDGNQCWSCKECKQTHSDKSLMRNHVETHISGLCYECPLCPVKK